MNDHDRRHRLNRVLDDLADELDVSPSMYNKARQHYKAVGAWLDDETSELAHHDPSIYPQGSFALGTAVKPRGDEEYDVDAVCLLQLTRNQVTQQQLKEMVGRRLKHPRSRYKDMIKPKEGGRRCWTIRYAEGSKFHLDILPAIPDVTASATTPDVPPAWAAKAICLTDRKLWNRPYADWPRSNPKGYVAWFKERMRFEAVRRVRAGAIRAQVESIEVFDVRTPLQRLVQILKRDRDERFNGDEDKPISIIITTLAAQAYDNEADLADAVLKVVPRMRKHIRRRDNAWWVPNPVNPMENFADKWAEESRKADLFFGWLEEIEREYRHLLTDHGFAKIGDYLRKAFGGRDGDAVIARQVRRGYLPESVLATAPIVVVPRKSEQSPAPNVELPSSPSKPWRP